MKQAPAQATVFFCHGSRDPDWRGPFDLLVADYRRRFPQQPVRLAFLELMGPSLPEALGELADSGIASVQVFPLFLAPGAHTSRDLPTLVSQARLRWPQLQVAIGATLLESDQTRAAVIDALRPAAAFSPPL